MHWLERRVLIWNSRANGIAVGDMRDAAIQERKTCCWEPPRRLWVVPVAVTSTGCPAVPARTRARVK